MTLWCQKLIDACAAHGPGSYVTDFPTYRPDLVEHAAAALSCAYVDFRSTRMAPLKAAAPRLALAAIEDCIAAGANERGIVVQNGEALLATRPDAERRAWLQEFLDRPRDRIAVLPLALFGREVPAHARVVRFLPHELPAETLISQLSTMRFQ